MSSLRLANACPKPSGPPPGAGDDGDLAFESMGRKRSRCNDHATSSDWLFVFMIFVGELSLDIAGKYIIRTSR